MMANLRWNVTITYRTDRGLMDVDHAVMELGDIETLVERGPSFEAIERIVAVYAFGTTMKTIEQAAAE